jgi:hypothetical protein
MRSRRAEKRTAYRIFVEKLEGKRPLERRRYRWVNNIKMDLGGIGLSGMGRFYLAQDMYHWRALVNIHFGFIKYWDSTHRT